MLVILLIWVALTAVLNNGAILDFSSKSQELFIYQQKLNIVHDMLVSECPDYVDKIVSRRSLQPHIAVARQLYTKLMNALAECKANKANITEPTTTAKPSYKDCQELYENGYNTSGIYEIAPHNLSAFPVWCDFLDNHGWTVMQKRFDGSVDFDVGWSEYKNGFGNISGEYWLGNDKVHALTETNRKLNIYMQVGNKASHSLYWDHFTISNESDQYRLRISGYTGDLVDQFSGQYDIGGMQFSTKDQDNDFDGSRNCAGYERGGWWYSHCSLVILNGKLGAKGTYWMYKGYLDRPSADIPTIVMRLTRD